MPEKKYYVNIPGTTEPTVLSENDFLAKKDKLYTSYPDANVVEMQDYNQDEEVGDTDFFINIPGSTEPTQMSAKDFAKKRDKLYATYPDVQVSRIRPINFRTTEAAAPSGYQQGVEAVTGGEEEFKMSREKQAALDAKKQRIDDLKAQLDNYNKSASEELAAIPGQQQRVIRESQQMPKRKELEKQLKEAERSYYTDPNYLGQNKVASDQIDKADKELDELIAPIREESKERRSKSPIGAAGGYAMADMPSYDEMLYTAAKNLNKDSKRLYDAPSKYEPIGGAWYNHENKSNGFNQFMKGAGERASEADFWSMGLTGMVDQYALKDVFKKIQNELGGVGELTEANIDEKLSPMEKQLLAAFFRNADAQARRAEDLSNAYQAGRSAVDSAQFMAEFALSGGITGGIGKAALEVAPKSVKTFAKWISKTLAKETPASLTKGAVKLGTDLGKGAINMWFQPGTYKAILEAQNQFDENGNLVNQSKAAWNAILDRGIEVFSESTGDYIPGILGWGASKLGADKLIGKLANTELGKWGRAFYNSDALKTLKAGGWNGYFGEMSEEFIGAALRTATGIDPDAWKEQWDKDNLAVMALSFIPMSVIGGTVSTVKYGVARKNLADSQEQMPAILQNLGFNDEQIAHAMDVTQMSSPEKIRETIKPIVDEMASRGATKADQDALMNYAMAAATVNAYDGFESARVEQERTTARNELEQTYGEFWHGKEGEQTVERVTLPDGKSGYVQDTDETGLMTVKWDDGTTSFTSTDLGAQVESMPMNQYLDGIILSDKQAREAARMQEDAAVARQQFNTLLSQNTSVPIGTQEAQEEGKILTQQDPNTGAVTPVRDADGNYTVVTMNGQTKMSENELAAKWGLNLQPKTDQQIEEDEVAQYEASKKRVDAYNTIQPGTKVQAQLEGLEEPVEYEFTHAVYNEETGEVEIKVWDAENQREETLPESAFPDLSQAAAEMSQRTEVAEESAAENAQTPEDTTPRDYRGKPLPLKDDGSVNQGALWEDSPEAWAAWNDQQRQDGGENSKAYIQAAVKTVEGEVAELQKAYASELDFDRRAAIEQQIAEKTQRAQELNNVLNGYEARAKQAEEAAKAEQEAAAEQPEGQITEESKSVQALQEKQAAAAEEQRRVPLRARALAWAEKTGVEVELLESIDQVQNAKAVEAIKKNEPVKGWYESNTGKVYIYLPNMVNETDVDRTYIHEVISHKGLKEMLDGAFTHFLDKVWNDLMDERARTYYTNYVKATNKNVEGLDLQRAAADEFVAFYSEHVDLEEDKNLWEKIVWMVRQFLVELGMPIEMTKEDLSDLLRASMARYREIVENGEATPVFRRQIDVNTGGGVQMNDTDANPTRFSIRGTVNGAGLEVVTDDGNGNVAFETIDGRRFDGNNPISAQDIKELDNTVMSYMMADARKLGTITPEQEDRIWQMYADQLNSFLQKGLAENGGFDHLASLWEYEVANTVYKTVATNSDAQYAYSLDITRVCKKNEAVIKAISAMQNEVGYGITPGQIMDIYLTGIEEGYQVPCPVCYVFSRYINNGVSATIAINGQRKYGDKLVDPRTLTPAERKKQIDFWKKELRKQEKLNKENSKSIANAKADCASIIEEINELSRQITSGELKDKERQEAIDRIHALDRRYRAAFDVVTQAGLMQWIKQFAIHEVNNKWELWEDTFQGFPEQNALDLRLTADTIENYPAIQRLRKSRGAAGGKEIHFASNNDIGDIPMMLGASNLDKTQNFYKLAAMETNPKERKKLLDKASKRFADAHRYAQQQSLRGGQRMWSWSDNIERLAPDVAMNLMQMQLLGGALQSYSKQLEGVNLVASMNGYVNGSLMGYGRGFQQLGEEDIEVVDGREVLSHDITDTVTEKTPEGSRERTRILAKKGSPVFTDSDMGKVTLLFDDVVGIDAYGRERDGKHLLGLFDLNDTLDKAGNIIVGMNDTHVRAAMADGRIFFIIPWHASGNSVHIVQEMLSYLGVDTDIKDYTDYTNVQEEKDIKNGEIGEHLVNFWEAHKNEEDFDCGIEGGIPSGDGNGHLSEQQRHYRELRDAIFIGFPVDTGKKNKDGSPKYEYHPLEERPEWLAEVQNDQFLRQAYDKVRNTVDAQEMTNGDTKFIYPYEYWDETSTYDTADVNGARYLEYCRRLGYKPKFVGKLDGKPEKDFGNFADDKGYWKLLIDRRMYDVNGEYQDLDPTSTDDYDPQMADPEWTGQNFEITRVADDPGSVRIAESVIAQENERFPGGIPVANYDNTLAKAVDNYKKVLAEEKAGEVKESVKKATKQALAKPKVKAETVDALKSVGIDLSDQAEEESDEMLFRMGDPSTEEGNTFFRTGDGTLVGLHNISEDKLRKADKAGGLANPSAAVIDITKQEHNNFGEISLVMPSAMVAATSGKNSGTYLGDAWTPTFPGTQKKMSKAGARAFDKQIMDLPAEVRYNVENAFENYLEEDRDGNALRWWFLNDTGRNPSVILHESPYSEEDAKVIESLNEWELKDEDIRTLADLYRKYAPEEEVRKATTKYEPREEAVESVRKWMREYNEEIDKYGINVASVERFLRQAKDQIRRAGRLDDYKTMDTARQFIEDNNLGEEFRSWIEGKEEEFGVETKLFAGWDRNGYKKWLDYTAENASKLMNKENGRNAYSDNGLSATHALLVRKMRTLAEIRKNKDLLVTRAEYDERYDQVDKELHSAISVLDNMQKISDNPFTNYDYTASRLQEALSKANPVAYLNNEYKYSIPENGEYAQQLERLKKDIMEMPVNYFETKFNRPVGLNEFTSAVVPSNLDEKTRKILEDANVKMFEYDPKEEGSRREATMKATEQEGIRFRITPEQDAEYMEAVNAGDMDKAGQMVENVARAAGYEYEGYHESINEFTVFEPGHRSPRTSESIDDASPVGWFSNKPNNGFYGPNAYHVFIKMRSPYILRGDSEAVRKLWKEDEQLSEEFYSTTNIRRRKEITDRRKEIKAEVERIEPFNQLVNMARWARLNYPDAGATLGETIRKVAESEFYDGIIFEDTAADGKFGQNWYIPFEGYSNIKSADPVTRDDQGNVIPLSERFNEGNDDIRFRIADRQEGESAYDFVNRSVHEFNKHYGRKKDDLVAHSASSRNFGEYVPAIDKIVIFANEDLKTYAQFERGAFHEEIHLAIQNLGIDVDELFNRMAAHFKPETVERNLQILRDDDYEEDELHNEFVTRYLESAAAFGNADRLLPEIREITDDIFKHFKYEPENEVYRRGDSEGDGRDRGGNVPATSSGEGARQTLPDDEGEERADASTRNEDGGVAEEAIIRFRAVQDPLKVAELEAGEKIPGYRTVVLNPDGSMASPMAGELGVAKAKKSEDRRVKTSSFTENTWNEAEENPDLADENGKIKLIKTDNAKRGLVDVDEVDYNPYNHLRLSPVNLQFKDAWKRPDLIYIKSEVPKSEAVDLRGIKDPAEKDRLSPYHAEKAVLPVGIHDWSGGGELLLSRWDKPVGQVAWEEIADAWANDEKVKEGVQFDRVPPQILDMLVERGIEILPPSKGKDKNEAYKAWKAGDTEAYEAWRDTGKAPKKDKAPKKAENEQASDNTVFRIAYHGSPNEFEEFDTSFVGDGQGHQSHGWGIYVSLEEGTARRYGYLGDRDKVVYQGQEPPTYYAKELVATMTMDMANKGTSFDEAKKSILDSLNYYEEKRKDAGNYWRDTSYKREIDFFENLTADDFKFNESHRNLYTVDIPDDTGENYIDEQKNLKKPMRIKIAEAIRALPADAWKISEDEAKLFHEYTAEQLANKVEKGPVDGEKVYAELSHGLGSPRAASEFLSNAGFVGIKYVGGVDGPCAVIFDAKDVEIDDHTRFRITPEQDLEYMDAVSAGDMEKAQSMVNEAAKTAMPNTKVVDENGNPLIVYHGTQHSDKQADFNVFNLDRRMNGRFFGDGYYFTDSKELGEKFARRFTARGWSGTDEYETLTPRLIPAFLNIENMIDVSVADTKTSRELEYAIKESRRTMRDNGVQADGMVVRGIMDGYDIKSDVYVAYDPNQIKSAEPVTYDDDGNVIPLSQRFNESNQDIRFRVTGTADDLVKRVQDYGLRGILDEDAAKAFWADAYAVMPEDARREIVDKAFSTDSDKQELNIRRYTRQYIADLAKKGYAEDESGLLRYLADKIKAELGQDLDENTLRYLIWRSANRYASNNILDMAEDIAMRRRLGVGEFNGEKFPTGVSEATDEAENRIDEAENEREEERNEIRRTAPRTPFAALNRAMTAQRKYDQETVSSIVALAKDMIKKGNIDKVSAREMARLMTIIKDANGRKPATVKAATLQLLDFMVDHTVGKEKELLDKMLKVRTAKVREPGVDTIAKLDLRAQNIINNFRDNYQLSEDEIDKAISTLEDELDDRRYSESSREDMRSKLEGLQLAKQYAADIAALNAEIKEIIRQKKAEEAKFNNLSADEKKAMRAAFNEGQQAADEMIRAKKIQQVDAYRRLRGDIAKAIDEGAERAKTFLEAERERVEQIHHWANSDMQGVSADVRDRKLTGWAKFANSSFAKLFTAPLANLDQMLRTLGRKSPEGRGYLWNWMMGAVRNASDTEKLGIDAAEKKLNDKVSEIFDEPGMEWNDLYSIERKMPKAKMRYFSANGEWVEEELTQGNLLYIYMVNKMTDGRMKLRQMNITDETVEDIKKALDPRFVELADWIQEEFLPGLRDRYNETHKRLFGTSMASIENYFPLRILGGVIEEKRNVGDQEQKTLPTDITGAIIKRTVNPKQLNLAGTDAFSLVVEHVREMEHWNAYAEASRDFSTLLKYKRFQNQLKQLNTIYGAGKDLMNLFWDTVNLSVGAFRPTTTPTDKAFLNLAKGVTAAKISFRAYTAIKQILSWPAFLADTNPLILGKNTLPINWKKNWDWAMENLPNFKKRVESRKAGLDILEDTSLDSKFWGTDFAKWINQNGMFMNAFVDALTVSIGARSVYETKKARYLKEGFSEEEADKKAKMDAEVLYNETQQSSEKEFMSTMQAHRTVANVALSAYRNSSMGYQRQLHQALRTLGRMTRKGYKSESIEYMTKQLEREGLSTEDAEKAAINRYERAGWQALVRVAVFGWLVQFAWNLGAHAVYLLFGDDPDEKKNMLVEDATHALIGGPIEGLAAGNIMSEAFNMIKNGENLRNWDPTTLPIMSDIKSTISKMSSDPVAGANDLVYLAAQIGLGTNPQTISDAIVAIVDACNGDFETAREVMFCIMRILAVPQSQLDQLMIDEIGMSAKDARELSYEDVARRYVDYKMSRNAPVTGPLYPDELREKREKSLNTTFKKKVNERKKLKEEE